ncbi:hypothetical protein K0651_03625 [Ornithinimicrobium sp. Arc0846-15]|nr:hypothetical protein [Ornithinimicrobium laminariae]
MDQQRKPDEDRVKQIRRLMSEGGDRAVEKRFGPEATSSEEYKEAQRRNEQQMPHRQPEKVAVEQDTPASSPSASG